MNTGLKLVHREEYRKSDFQSRYLLGYDFVGRTPAVTFELSGTDSLHSSSHTGTTTLSA